MSRNLIPCITVLVLGDIGRSPRMMYHALCLTQSHRVTLIGYGGSELPASLFPSMSSHRLTVHYLKQFTGVWIDRG